jgi:hypothetical protein
MVLGNTSSDFVATCGNVTNRNLRQLLTAPLPDALEQLRQGAMKDGCTALGYMPNANFCVFRHRQRSQKG